MISNQYLEQAASPKPVIRPLVTPALVTQIQRVEPDVATNAPVATNKPATYAKPVATNDVATNAKPVRTANRRKPDAYC
jgi:hypothetical protein